VVRLQTDRTGRRSNAEWLDDLVDAGLVADADRAMALRDAERAIDDIESRRGIFSDKWTSMRRASLPSVVPLELPPGWSDIG
jgi:hypothetical protein